MITELVGMIFFFLFFSCSWISVVLSLCTYERKGGLVPMKAVMAASQGLLGMASLLDSAAPLSEDVYLLLGSKSNSRKTRSFRLSHYVPDIEPGLPPQGPRPPQNLCCVFPFFILKYPPPSPKKNPVIVCSGRSGEVSQTLLPWNRGPAGLTVASWVIGLLC